MANPPFPLYMFDLPSGYEGWVCESRGDVAFFDPRSSQFGGLAWTSPII